MCLCLCAQTHRFFPQKSIMAYHHHTIMMITMIMIIKHYHDDDECSIHSSNVLCNSKTHLACKHTTHKRQAISSLLYVFFRYTYYLSCWLTAYNRLSIFLFFFSCLVWHLQIVLTEMERNYSKESRKSSKE